MLLEHFIVDEAFIINSSLISEITTHDDLITLCIPENKLKFTPGSAQISIENKNSTSGPYFLKEFTCTIAGNIDNDFKEYLHNAGALVIKDTTPNYIFFFKNDAYQNIPLRPEIVSTGLKTQIKYTINTLFFP